MRITDIVWKERIVEKLSEKHGMALPISARDMDPSERSYYERHK